MKNLKFERETEIGKCSLEIENVGAYTLIYVHQNLMSACYALTDEEAEQLAKHLLEYLGIDTDFLNRY